MKPLSKEEIIADALMRIKATDGTNEIGEYMSGAMDSWADQQSRIAAIGFQKWLGDNYDYNEFEKSWGKFWEIDEEVNQDFDAIPTDQLYNLFIQDQNKKQ